MIFHIRDESISNPHLCQKFTRDRKNSIVKRKFLVILSICFILEYESISYISRKIHRFRIISYREKNNALEWPGALKYLIIKKSK